MEILKKAAIGAGLAWGAVYLAGMAASYSTNNPGKLSPDNFLVKFNVPLAGAAVFVGAHFAKLV